LFSQGKCWNLTKEAYLLQGPVYMGDQNVIVIVLFGLNVFKKKWLHEWGGEGGK
jgi:hypothetical protein